VTRATAPASIGHRVRRNVWLKPTPRASFMLATIRTGAPCARYSARHHGFDSIGALINLFRRKQMGKYFLAWIFGVPAAVLAVIYLLMH
jgi:hypothetical protein